MSDDATRLLLWVALGVGIVAVFMVLEVLLRTLFTRFGAPAENSNTHRTGTELPRVLNKN